MSGWKKEFQERVNKAVEDTDSFRTKDRLTEAPTYVEQLKELGERLAAYAKERDTINREEVLVLTYICPIRTLLFGWVENVLI